MYFDFQKLRPLAYGLFTACVLVSGHVAAQSTASTNGQNYIVAVVDAEPITNVDVHQRALQLSQQLRQQDKPVPSQAQLLNDALNKLIDEKALL